MCQPTVKEDLDSMVEETGGTPDLKPSTLIERSFYGGAASVMANVRNIIHGGSNVGAVLNYIESIREEMIVWSEINQKKIEETNEHE